MRWKLVAALALVAAACSPERVASAPTVAGDHPLFGEVVPLSKVVGTELVSSHVVPLTCIPNRTDPVGVFVGIEIVDWALRDGRLDVTLKTGHARLGSHPSGCGDPTVVLGDSMFLIGPDDETVHASSTATTADGLALGFDLGDRTPASWSAVLLPTIDYALASGERQTSIYGLVGHYTLN